MFQPILEKTLILELGQKIEIDNMIFYLKRIQADWKTNDFSISIWGSEPNATTLHHSRVIKLEDYIWRPEKNGLSFNTLEGKSFYSMSFNEEKLKNFISDQYEGKDEIINCWVNITTMINESRGYDFSRQ